MKRHADEVPHSQAPATRAPGLPSLDARTDAGHHEGSAGERDAERLARTEQLFSAALLESMPGIVYFYDEQGRFLRWNHGFARATGYAPDEIVRLHPLDVIAPDDRNLVRDRIAAVLESGESWVEARLLTKLGAEIPYLFTGRRVTIDGMRYLVGIGIDVAERKAVADRLGESERRYRELVERANSIILRWRPDGRITFLNEYGQRFFGYSADELVGRDVMETIVPTTESSGRNLARLMELVRSDPTAFEQNVNENIRRNGERVSIAWTNRIERDAAGEVAEIFSVGTDITRLIQAETALRASEERYRTTVESILEACQLIGHDWTYLYLNGAAAGQNGRPNAELLGRTMMECWPGIESTAVFALLNRSMTERRAVHEEVAFQFADGQSRWFDVRSQPVPEGIFVLSIDISERKRAETALREINDTLELKVAERTAELAEARDRAESADRIKSAFLATMSHELRTPLNSILGFTGILLQGLAGSLNPEQSKQLGMVRTSARHLLDLINDVLDISKIEAGQLDLHLAPFELGAAIARAVQSVAPMAGKKGLEVIVRAPDDLAPVTSDRRRVEQVLLNLLSNAIKFTDHGQVTVTVRIVEGETPEVAVAVADTGIGISKAGLADLFKPFRQLDSGLTRQHEGTGLGLAICHRLATLMGGAIDAESEPGAGSTFTLRLPLAPEKDAA